MSWESISAWVFAMSFVSLRAMMLSRRFEREAPLSWISFSMPEIISRAASSWLFISRSWESHSASSEVHRFSSSSFFCLLNLKIFEKIRDSLPSSHRKSYLSRFLFMSFNRSELLLTSSHSRWAWAIFVLSSFWFCWYARCNASIGDWASDILVSRSYKN